LHGIDDLCPISEAFRVGFSLTIAIDSSTRSTSATATIRASKSSLWRFIQATPLFSHRRKLHYLPGVRRADVDSTSPQGDEQQGFHLTIHVTTHQSVDHVLEGFAPDKSI
jgi:hypothetical protein